MMYHMLLIKKDENYYCYEWNRPCLSRVAYTLYVKTRNFDEEYLFFGTEIDLP